MKTTPTDKIDAQRWLDNLFIQAGKGAEGRRKRREKAERVYSNNVYSRRTSKYTL